ncbi:MAG: hypothetical protein J6Q85_06775 [Clostridia bacterium]|nr:hypothetical protein [Clostridia bacterium]
MDIYTVALFGHREISDLRGLEEAMTPVIEEVISNHSYVSFLIGRNGEFDEYAASVIKRVRRTKGEKTTDITLVLPYSVADIKYYESYYDSVIIPESLFSAHPKAKIELRNRYMVETADFVIAYVERNVGGAYRALKYAKKLKKQTVNLKNVENQRANLS